MSGAAEKYELIKTLQDEVLALQGFKGTSSLSCLEIGLGIIESAFANRKFPTAAVHEFISPGSEAAAATNGFIGGLLGSLMQKGSACLWISTRRTLFPPALKLFGITPEQIVFIDLSREKEALWTIEEALKCNALSAVVGEIKELSFTESRRLQLAVEKSAVTGFIHRYQPKLENTVACVSRWKIKPIASELEDRMPGVGFARWDVQLLKARNGKPGSWKMEWSAQGFRHIHHKTAVALPIQKVKAG